MYLLLWLSDKVPTLDRCPIEFGGEGFPPLAGGRRIWPLGGPPFMPDEEPEFGGVTRAPRLAVNEGECGESERGIDWYGDVADQSLPSLETGERAVDRPPFMVWLGLVND